MKPQRALDRLLRVFSDVREGEGLRVVGMVGSLLLLMISYYVLKTVREPLILATGGAEVKAYAVGFQALVLIGFVPAYGWLTRRVGRRGLILGLVGFFFVNLQLFYFANVIGMRFVGIAFFVWVGVFSLSVIAQFWSLANDVYTQEQGERLFPIIAFGATIGSPIGAKIAQMLFKRGISPSLMMQIAAVLLVAHGAIALLLTVGKKKSKSDQPMKSGRGGFALIWRSTYLRYVALLLMLLNLVNTVGEYILSKSVVAAAEQSADKAAFIGSFYGGFFFWVNVVAALAQALLVSRLVKWVGIKGVLLFLPMLALGIYGVIGMGVGFMVLRVLKTAENATDYSIMNTGKALLWLPTKREEKYRAKQAIDTLFVRFGDVIATLLVAGAVPLLHLGPRTLAVVNTVVCAAWILVAWRTAQHHAKLSNVKPTEKPAPKEPKPRRVIAPLKEVTQ
jgi:ATP:ADP antiporter, AAA family